MMYGMQTRCARAARDAGEIYHLAAQVAVTSSIDEPRTDFEVNACGTINVLEAARYSGLKPFLLFTSTNKVYGALDSLKVTAQGQRYRVNNEDFRGVNEQQQLDFHSPYGCSKGAADQYVRDYARIYDLPTVVFRMSCIAGPRQFGNEDQGWVAHFLYSALNRVPITIYGSGLQVRDVLHVSDLIDAMNSVRLAGKRTHGEVYNVGGGRTRAVSVKELLGMIEARTGAQLDIRTSPVRPGDQPLYISDTTLLEAHTGWRAQHSMTETLAAIHEFWLKHHRQIRAITESAVARPQLAEEVA